MPRCNQCYSVVTRKDDESCYMCGEPVPGAKKRSQRRKKESKPVAPVTPLSNLFFIASLLLTVVSLLSGQRISLSIGVTLSAALLIARILSDRMAARRQLALRPVTGPRLHY